MAGLLSREDFLKKLEGKEFGDLGKRYERVGDALGAGSFGEVFRYRLKKGHADLPEDVAVKILHRHVQRSLDESAAREFNIQTSLDHPNIVKCHGYCVVDGDIAFAMEFCQRDLESYIEEHGIPSEHDPELNMLPEEQADSILRQLCSGLEYMRDQGPHGIVHRDLKPGNILVKGTDPLRVGITDFGYAKTISSAGTSKMTKAGTPYYVAPEMFREGKLHRSEAGDMGHAADVYSVGVIALRLFTGLHVVIAQAGENIVTFDLQEKITKISDPLLRDFVLLCLKWDPDDRIKKRELLHHLYFLPRPPTHELPRGLYGIREMDLARGISELAKEAYR